MRPCLCLIVMLLCGGEVARGADWVRAGLTTNQPVWGLRGGLQFAIPPGGFRPGEPRGLIRLGAPILPGGGYDLVNFIAVEPVVNGRKGFSELEQSKLDGTRGKRLWAVPEADRTATNGALEPGTLTRLGTGVERLEVALRVEKFENGAHVWLAVSQRSDAPDEIQLTIHAEPDRAAMDFCILTATMGNMARTRQLWLKEQMVTSLKLYPAYTDAGFAPHTFYPLDRLHLTEQGEVIVAITTDEEHPAAVFPFPGSGFWHYGGAKVTQFWKKPRGSHRADLQAAVNARHTYWMSRQPIPGGIAFENFELRERFHAGQTFIFGITRRTPSELGWRAP